MGNLKSILQTEKVDDGSNYRLDLIIPIFVVLEKISPFALMFISDDHSGEGDSNGNYSSTDGNGLAVYDGISTDSKLGL
jgi:hypothetical protein